MTSTVEVREKTVNNREVIAFVKEYNQEQHEVFVPKQQATQVLLDLLATVNEQKEEQSNQFVLIRKSELGYIHE